MNISWACVDAGTIIKLVVKEDLRPQTLALWQSWIDNELQAVAPTLFAYEVTSVLRKKVHRGLITPDEGEKALSAAFNLDVKWLAPPDLHRHAWQLAARFNRPAAYDAHYLALAEMLGCDLWTADRRLFNAVRDELPWVEWLGDFAP